MNILLDGYFDRNFGDDVMQETVISSFPEHSFFVNFKEREMLAHLEKYENVFINQSAQNIDMHLSVIGTGFMYNGKRQKAERIFSLLKSEKNKYKKSALINCSMEPIADNTARWLVKNALNRYGLITCRDEGSLDIIKGVHSGAVKMYEDIVFSSGIDRYAKKADEGALGIAPVRRIYSDGNYDYLKKLAEAADYYVEKHNKKVLLFAFDSGMENDIAATLSIKNMMKHSEQAEIVIYNSDIKRFVENICRCSLFVTSRFHGLITALMCGIKAIAVSDREKLDRLCDKLSVCRLGKSDFNTADLIMNMNEDISSGIDSSVKMNSSEHIKRLAEYMAE